MDKTIVKNYLLGRLPEAERGGVDARVLTDVEFYEQLLAEEDELIDEYLSGVLDAEERESFERVFLVLDERRDKLQFARALHARLKAEAAESTLKSTASATSSAASTQPGASSSSPASASSPAAVSWWRRLFAAPPSPGYAAAIVLATAAAVTIYFTLLRSPRPPAGAAASAEQLSQITAERDRLRQELAQKNAELAQLQSTPSAGVTPPATPSTAAPAVPAFVLSPLLVRDAGSASRITIPADAAQINLTLELDGAEYQTYSARLETEDEREVRSWPSLAPVRRGGARQLRLQIPASELAPGLYQILLRAVEPDGKQANAGRYVFRVVAGRR